MHGSNCENARPVSAALSGLVTRCAGDPGFRLRLHPALFSCAALRLEGVGVGAGIRCHPICFTRDGRIPVGIYLVGREETAAGRL